MGNLQPALAVRGLRFAELDVRTVEEATAVADMLAQAMPDPARAALGLAELLINGVEHGNLDLGGPLKCDLVRGGTLATELRRRLDEPWYRDRRVHVRFRRVDGRVTITIADAGRGFAWRQFVGESLAVSEAPHGRGIALARDLAFARIEYQDPGNVVVVTAECAP